MDITSKQVQVYLWKILKFSLQCCFAFVARYPLFSFILFLIFLSYMLVPSVFWFLVYSSPVLIFAIAYFRIFSPFNHLNTKDVDKDRNRNNGISCRRVKYVEGDVMFDKNKTTDVHNQPLMRRNCQEKNKDTDEEGLIEDKGTIFFTRFDNELVDKRALEVENPKEIREVKVDSLINCIDECSSSNAFKSSKHEFVNGFEEGYQKINNCSNGTEKESSEDGEDEQVRRNKVVEWNDNEKRKLMDLGISEVERNQRLENLIARRRARKLFSQQVRKVLMKLGNNDPQIASLVIPKNIPALSSSNYDEFPPIPGSAPSVLLPGCNPFDLPYEPNEEKPNLSGDSFHQEFMDAHQKDIMYCRHESFCLGTFSTLKGKSGLHETLRRSKFLTMDRGVNRRDKTNKENQLDEESHSEEVTQESSQVSENDLSICDDKQEHQVSDLNDIIDCHYVKDDGEPEIKEVQVEDFNGESSSSSSSGESGSYQKIDKEAILKSLLSAKMSPTIDRNDTSSTTNIVPNSSPFGCRKTWNYPAREILHMPTQSIDSDLHVELSEISTPPTYDGIISSPDGQCSIYDGETQKEINNDGEEIWEASSQLSIENLNEPRLRVREVNENAIGEDGFSRSDSNSEESVSMKMPTEIDFMSSNSLFLLSTELHKTGQHHQMDSPKSNATDHMQSFGNLGTSSPANHSFSASEELQQLREEPSINPPHDGGSEIPKELYPTLDMENHNGERKTFHNMNDTDSSVSDNAENFRNKNGKEIEADTSIKTENNMDLSKWHEGTHSTSSEYDAIHSEDKYNIEDPTKPSEVISYSLQPELLEAIEEQPENESGERSTQDEDIHIQEFVEDSPNEQVLMEERVL